MRVIISPRAEKQLKKITKINQIAIVQKIQNLESVKPQTQEKLTGFKNIYRVRVGDYRIVYQKTATVIYIILIRHKKDVYKMLKVLIR